MSKSNYKEISVQLSKDFVKSLLVLALIACQIYLNYFFCKALKKASQAKAEQKANEKDFLNLILFEESEFEQKIRSRVKAMEEHDRKNYCRS